MWSPVPTVLHQNVNFRTLTVTYYSNARMNTSEKLKMRNHVTIFNQYFTLIYINNYYELKPEVQNILLETRNFQTPDKLRWSSQRQRSSIT
jgi:hypothetical protein